MNVGPLTFGSSLVHSLTDLMTNILLQFLFLMQMLTFSSGTLEVSWDVRSFDWVLQASNSWVTSTFQLLLLYSLGWRVLSWWLSQCGFFSHSLSISSKTEEKTLSARHTDLTTRSGKALNMFRCGARVTLPSWIKEWGGGTTNNKDGVSSKRTGKIFLQQFPPLCHGSDLLWNASLGWQRKLSRQPVHCWQSGHLPLRPGLPPWPRCPDHCSVLGGRELE